MRCWAIKHATARSPWRPLHLFAAVAVLLVAIGDELLASYQFNALCQEQGVESTDVTVARGRTLNGQAAEESMLIATAVPIWRRTVTWTDIATSAALLQHQDFRAEGGWLARHFASEGERTTPLLFDGASCPTQRRDAEFRLFDVKVVRAP